MLFAQACHGLSWCVLLWIAAFGRVDGLSPAALAWIHLVALGWFTIAALSILLHVIPGFTDLKWRFETAARVSLGVLSAGVAAFVLSLALNQRFVGGIAALLLLSILAYAVVAWMTLAQARHAERAERAIARALSIVLFNLAVVAALGFVLALFLSGAFAAAWVAALPAAHANLGFYAWLSLLVYGVSARTIRPICGAKSRSAWVHVFVGAATLAGAFALAAGIAVGNAALTWAGGSLVGVAALAYAADAFGILRRATVRHRPPQAFIAAAVTWLLLGVALGGLCLAGRPFAPAYGFVLLAGWIGQMVNAHMLHIGTRVIATTFRGEDDETRPAELLDVRLEWVCFGLFQGAIGLTAWGLAVATPAFVGWGAFLGLAGWCAMAGAMAIAGFAAAGATSKILPGFKRPS